MADTTLSRQLAEAIGAADSPLIQKIFEVLVNDEEAKVLLAASPPATTGEIARKTGFPQGTIETMMESLFNKGLIFKARKGDETKYYRVRSVPQMHDSTVLTPGISKEVLDLWKAYMEKEWPEYGRKITDLFTDSFVRVIPIRESIEPESQILAFDDAVEIIENAKTLSLTKCSCRVVNGSCGKPM